MKVAVIGATGFVGSHIVNELATRNHEVTAISRNTNENQLPENVKSVTADVTNTAQLAEVLKGNDVVISSYNAGWTNPNLYNDFLTGSESIQQAVKDAGIKRLIIVGGAGSLLIDGKKWLTDQTSRMHTNLEQKQPATIWILSVTNKILIGHSSALHQG